MDVPCGQPSLPPADRAAPALTHSGPQSRDCRLPPLAIRVQASPTGARGSRSCNTPSTTPYWISSSTSPRKYASHIDGKTT